MDKMAAENFRQQQIAQELQQRLIDQTHKTRLSDIKARDLATKELNSRKLAEQFKLLEAARCDKANNILSQPVQTYHQDQDSIIVEPAECLF